MSREQVGGEPKREHAETEQAAQAVEPTPATEPAMEPAMESGGPATPVPEPTPRAPAVEPVRAGGQGKRESRPAGAVVGLSGSMRARDVSRPSVTPRHES